MEFRVGDVLTVSCPFTPAVVTELPPDHVALRWPWWQPDRAADGLLWNGDVALARDDDDPVELFRTQPPLSTLRVGDACRVGVPPTVVHVAKVQLFDPPRETGRLPRPWRELLLLRRGVSYDPAAEEQGYAINPDDGIPWEFTLHTRPFDALDPGDDVADGHGRAWRFDGPWNWHAYDGAGGFPRGPLTSIDTGRPVTSADSPGSADFVEAELDRWRAASGATVPGSVAPDSGHQLIRTTPSQPSFGPSR